MRITKKWLKEVKIRLTTAIVEWSKLSPEDLRRAVKNLYSDMPIHVTGCPNCGATDSSRPSLPSMVSKVYTCECSPAERQAAEADRRPAECLRIILMDEIERKIPSSMVD